MVKHLLLTREDRFIISMILESIACHRSRLLVVKKQSSLGNPEAKESQIVLSYLARFDKFGYVNGESVDLP